MPDIPSLTAEIDRLARAVGFWNTAIIVLMVGVAVVATGLVVAQQKAFRTADALAAATGQLSALKEGIANQKISAAGLIASQADARSTQLQKDNLIEQGKVAGLQANAATQQARAAAAEKSLLELQEKLRYRGISKEQHDAFLRATEGTPRGVVEISALSGDPESIAYAESLRTLLVDAGWTCAPVRNTLIMGDNAIGLTLIFQAVDQLEIDPRNTVSVVIPRSSPVFHGLAIVRGFEEAKIPLARSTSAMKAPSDLIILIVGAKP